MEHPEELPGRPEGRRLRAGAVGARGGRAGVRSNVRELPAQYVDAQDWHRYAVPGNVFSPGDLMVLEGEALKQVQIACGYFDLKAGKYAGGSSGAEPWGPGFPPGGFAGYSSLNLPPGGMNSAVSWVRRSWRCSP